MQNDLDTLPQTGERLLTTYFDENSVEHLHRYAVATPLCHGKDVVDIASGEGYGSNIISYSAKSVVGIDIAEEAISHAKMKYKKQNLSFIRGTAENIPIANNSKDVVVSFETLEHHDKHEEMLSEIKRILRPQGVLIMSTPDKHFYSDAPNFKNEYHVKELYLDEFRELISRYFKFVQIYHQDIILSSAILPSETRSVCTYLSGNHEDPIRESDTLPAYKYNICIASDAPPPSINASIFDAKPLLSIYRKRAELVQVKDQLENARKEINRLRSSTSFRIGRTLTFPFRFLLKFRQ